MSGVEELRSTACAADDPIVSTAPRNALRESLAARRFFWTLEFIPSADRALDDELRRLGAVADLVRHDPLLAGFAVTDRVHSDHDPDSIASAAALCESAGKQPLVHYSGKGRDPDELYLALGRVRALGLENMMFVSGDRLKQPPRDRRPRYLESVAAIAIAKRAVPDLLAAAAVNPFKYREEDAMAQYLKLGKKVEAGVDVVITQIGFDPRKYDELADRVAARGYRVSLVANVLPLSVKRARYIRRHRLPGVTITDSFFALLEAEARLLPDGGAARVRRRLALQILGARMRGYAGVQITGVHTTEELVAIQLEVERLAAVCPDSIAWQHAWREALIFPEGGSADPAPPNGWYTDQAGRARASLGERTRYRTLAALHWTLFDRGPAARLLGPLLKPVVRRSPVDRLLALVERAIKGPLLGCETCGFCRLAATQYVCPESCPKGLANGACGGTTENRCEFGDRECIHSVRYRIARDAGLLEQLESGLIPAVAEAARGTCSWPPHFRGERPSLAGGIR